MLGVEILVGQRPVPVIACQATLDQLRVVGCRTAGVVGLVAVVVPVAGEFGSAGAGGTAGVVTKRGDEQRPGQISRAAALIPPIQAGGGVPDHMVEQAKLLAVFSFDGNQADGSVAAVVAVVDHFIAAVVLRGCPVRDRRCGR